MQGRILEAGHQAPRVDRKGWPGPHRARGSPFGPRVWSLGLTRLGSHDGERGSHVTRDEGRHVLGGDL